MNQITLDTSERRMMRVVRPRTRGELGGWLRAVLGFHVPLRPIVPGHNAPMDYVAHAFFEDSPGPRDCAVWANRGGGKTQLGAIVTLLDLLFKPGIEIRILGGSMEQSSKMYAYLRRMLLTDVFSDLVEGKMTGKSVELRNGSRVEVLSQSERAVRGQRVHRLRCDEVELFDTEVWEAAQMVTRSGRCGNVFVRAGIEALSTMHRPFGLMHELVEGSPSAPAPSAIATLPASAHPRRVFRWSVLDVIERCPAFRSCEKCPLWEDCAGRAKRAYGFVRIDDAIQQRARTGQATWRAEMLCEKPTRRDTVYPEFDEAVHVKPLQRLRDAEDRPLRVIGGLDFGFRSPTVLLWAVVDSENVLHVVDELVEAESTVERTLALAGRRAWSQPEFIGADPAGHARNEQTATSTIALWRKNGWRVRTHPTEIEFGIMAVRRRLLGADGSVRLFIDPRCERLIRSLSCYHYRDKARAGALPVKDGHDHAADALRYMVVNLDREAMAVRSRRY